MGHVVGIVIHKSACTHGECGEQGAVIVDSCEIDAEIVGKLSARLSVLFGVEQLPVSYCRQPCGV